jgi:hypothetical protein
MQRNASISNLSLFLLQIIKLGLIQAFTDSDALHRRDMKTMLSLFLNHHSFSFPLLLLGIVDVKLSVPPKGRICVTNCVAK